MGFAGVLLFGQRRLHGTAFGALACELVIGTGVIGQFFVFEMQDRPNRTVQQRAVMADNNYRMGVFDQIVFQPERPLEIKIVGWLVKQ